MYRIKPYTLQRALQLGVKVKPSTNPTKKLDVFDWNKNYITSIGATGFKDFSQYLEDEKNGLVPKGYANERRRLYHIRHGQESKKLGDKYLGSRSYYTNSLLW